MVKVEKLIFFEEVSTSFLYKGLDTRAFPLYFKNGGIIPKNPNQPWITEDWSQAYHHAWEYQHIVEGNGFCFSVIDKSILDRNKITRAGPHSGHNIEPLYDYRGSDTVSWPEVKKLIVTQQAIDAIETAYQKLKPEDMLWNEFAKHFEILEYSGFFILQENLKKMWEELGNKR